MFIPLSLILTLTLTMSPAFIFTQDDETPAFVQRNKAIGFYCSGLIYSTWRSPRALRRQPLTFQYKLQSRRPGFIQRRRRLLVFSTTKPRQSEERSASMKTTFTTERKPTFSESSVNHKAVIYSLYSRGYNQYWHFYNTALLTFSNLNLVSWSHYCDQIWSRK